MRQHSMACEFPEGCSCGATEWNRHYKQGIRYHNRILELEAGVREIHSMARTVGYDSGHTGIETICKRLLRK